MIVREWSKIAAFRGRRIGLYIRLQLPSPLRRPVGFFGREGAFFDAPCITIDVTPLAPLQDTLCLLDAAVTAYKVATHNGDHVGRYEAARVIERCQERLARLSGRHG